MEAVQIMPHERVQICTVEANVHAPTPQVPAIVEVGQNTPQNLVLNLAIELDVKMRGCCAGHATKAASVSYGAFRRRPRAAGRGRK